MTLLARLDTLSRESVEIAKEIIPLMGKVPLDDLVDFRDLIWRLLAIAYDIIPSKEVGLNELAQNNYKFLDTLHSVVFRLLNYSDKEIPIDRNRLEFLGMQTSALLKELNSPPFLQHRKRPPTDKFTEPQIPFFNSR